MTTQLAIDFDNPPRFAGSDYDHARDAIEEWRPVVGYEGLYEVSDKGRVRSLWCANGRVLRKRDTPYVLKQSKHGFGYLTVNLAKNGKHATTGVHTIVCAAFRGPAPEGTICGHDDNDPANNRLGNLNWITYSKNNGDDRQRHGTALNGSTNPQAKLTEAKVRELLLLHEQGLSLGQLAKRFEVSKPVVWKITRRQLWKHVTTEV